MRIGVICSYMVDDRWVSVPSGPAELPRAREHSGVDRVLDEWLVG